MSPIDELPGGYRPHRRNTSILPTPRALKHQNVAWDRVLSIIFGVLSVVFFFGFLYRGQALEQASTNMDLVKEELNKAREEASHLRSSVSYFEQEINAKESASTSLRREVTQYRDQADRLGSMLEGYRSQVHKMEVQLSNKDKNCKTREEELEAAVAKAEADHKVAEQRVKDEFEVSHHLQIKVGRLERDLAIAQEDLTKCQAGTSATSGVTQDTQHSRKDLMSGSDGHDPHQNSNPDSSSEVGAQHKNDAAQVNAESHGHGAADHMDHKLSAL